MGERSVKMVWLHTAPGSFEGIPGPVVEDVDLRLLSRRILASNLPWGTRATHRFEQWRERQGLDEAFSVCKAFATDEAPHHFLTLSGPVGVGKTHLAVAIGWTWIETERGGVYYSQVEDLLDRLRGTVRRMADAGALDMTEQIDLLKHCDLLILDDLGAHHEKLGDGPSWATAKLDEIIDHRYIRGGHTVFTTNVKQDALPPRIADRMFEGRVTVLQALSSYRKEKSAR